MNLDEMSLEALKAAAYDQIVVGQQAQQNLAAINEMIRQKLTQPSEPKKLEVVN